MNASARLDGVTIALTQAAERQSKLAAALVAFGAHIVSIPTVRTVEPGDQGASLEQAVAMLTEVSWLLVCSPTAVGRLEQRIPGGVGRAPGHVGAIGPGTAEALATLGVEVDLVPDRYVAEGLLEAFESIAPHTVDVVVIVGSQRARPVLFDGLTRQGFNVFSAFSHSTESRPIERVVIDQLHECDAVAFASSSAVTGFCEAVGRSDWPPVAACIGPISAATARAFGFDRVIQAERHDISGLVEVVCDILGTPAQ